MLPVAILRFSPTESPGRFGAWLTAHGVPWELVAIDDGASVPVATSRFSGVGMMGGPMSVNDDLPWVDPLCAFLRDAMGDSVPVIGHCLGGQLMAKALGAKVTRMPAPEIGWFHVDVCDRGARRDWFGGLPLFPAFQWHYDAFELPPMATRVLRNDIAVNQGFVIDDRHIGFQCHIEMTRELVETWCRVSSDELPARSSGHQQSALDIQSDLDTRLAALGEVADGVYARWAQGLVR
ncbi:MAG: type 1 glutamine amidotransferase [Betaproteobacteria bacterium]